MSLEIKGRCIQVLPVETGMGKKGQWNKLVFVIETAAQYPKKIAMTLWDINKAPAVGDDLTCSVDPESREYNMKWYTDLRCWKIEGFTGNLKKPLQQTNPKVDDDGVDWGKSSVGGSQDDLGDLPF
jgi:hypothetical protein